MKQALLLTCAAEHAGRAELLVAAHRLVGRAPYETTCVTVEPAAAPLSRSDRPGATAGATAGSTARGDRPGAESVDGLVQALDGLHHETGFDVILLRGSHLTGMLAPRLAARLGAPLVTEVVDVRRHAGSAALVRQAGKRRLLVGIARRAGRPLVAVIRPGAFAGAPVPREATRTVALSPSPVAGERIVAVGRRPKDLPDDIRDAEILVAGGGGVLGSFAELEDLAAALGGLVAASRRAVDHGAAVRSIQVGQSGRTVSPRLYVAIGIDGAGQHIEGLQDIETIIAVNTNRHAPICSISDVVVEGDAREFVERLCRRIAQGAMPAAEP